MNNKDIDLTENGEFNENNYRKNNHKSALPFLKRNKNDIETEIFSNIINSNNNYTIDYWSLQYTTSANNNIILYNNNQTTDFTYINNYYYIDKALNLIKTSNTDIDALDFLKHNNKSKNIPYYVKNAQKYPDCFYKENQKYNNIIDKLTFLKFLKKKNILFNDNYDNSINLEFFRTNPNQLDTTRELSQAEDGWILNRNRFLESKIPWLNIDHSEKRIGKRKSERGSVVFDFEIQDN